MFLKRGLETWYGTSFSFSVYNIDLYFRSSVIASIEALNIFKNLDAVLIAFWTLMRELLYNSADI